MKIGFIGLGKLGLPVATCMTMRGHDVKGYDVRAENMSKGPRPYIEAGPEGSGSFDAWLSEAERLTFGSVKEVCEHSEIIFVAVQTPHDPRYEGISHLPEDRVDFDYSWLKAAIVDLSRHIHRPTIVAVISTVLPGTMAREIEPLLNPHMHLAYTPSFIAMGTTMQDYLNPEFFLLGTRGGEVEETMRAFFQTIADAPVMGMTVESAELSKVAYNTFISAKIGIVNTLMEICDIIPGADIDQVSDALCAAKKRVISPAYMRGGMGDGGGCHPRDNIAMSWLARKYALGHDIFESVMLAREGQAGWLAQVLTEIAESRGLEMGILGTAYKAGSGITVGSHALLVLRCLMDNGTPPAWVHDPHANEADGRPDRPLALLIGCNHPEFRDYSFPPGTVLLDPWRYIPAREGVEIIRLGASERGENHALSAPRHHVAA